MTPFPWVEDDARRAILERALMDLGECEVPPGSNRSPRIDAYNKASGAPVGSYWCASWATTVLADCGVPVPAAGRASCDVIVSWAMKRGTWIRNNPQTSYPRVQCGDLILYTNGKTLSSGNLDAYHVGIVFRVEPYLLSLEGNAAYAGFSANGEAVVLKRVDVSKVYGFVRVVT